jgi:hypothetical protein
MPKLYHRSFNLNFYKNIDKYYLVDYIYLVIETPQGVLNV